MEKLEFTKKDPGPPPPPTTCKRCGKEANPKLIQLIGWRQQEHCELCSKIVAEEREREMAIRERKEKTARLLESSGMRGIMRGMTFDSFSPQ